MNCDEFLERFSEFRDRDEGGVEVDAFERHLETCVSCRRYRDVVERGVELVRSLSGPKPRPDFQARLRHRIYHADLMSEKPRGNGGAPLIAVALLAAGVLAGVGAWGSISPVLAPPTVALPGITATAPPPAPSPRGAALDAEGDPAARSPAFLTQSDLWSQSNLLLYEHSSLYHKVREGSLVRTGLH